jgi:hypothetical protein
VTQTGVLLPENRNYPGVFISGDDALYRYGPALRRAVLGEDTMSMSAATAILRELERLLASCEVTDEAEFISTLRRI